MSPTSFPHAAESAIEHAAEPPAACYVIEIEDEQVGLVVQDGAGFRFFSAVARLASLDGRRFGSARAATRAVRLALAERSGATRSPTGRHGASATA